MSDQWQQDHSLLDDDRYQEAINLFNAREWYAAHDAFEELWHESVGEERAVFQGIIQIAVAEHHLRNGNRRGSLLLMAEGLNHLQAAPPQGLGFDLPSLQAIVSQRLAGLQTGQTLDDIPLPVLQPSVPSED
jgi:predicted metal-dependent hydrolase